MVVRRTVPELVESAVHAGDLAGADAVGEATGGMRLVVRIGIWVADGRDVRARIRATTCASLIAYAEAACTFLEAGTHPVALDADLLRRAVEGVHPVHLDRASLVAAAVPRRARASPKGAIE